MNPTDAAARTILSATVTCLLLAGRPAVAEEQVSNRDQLAIVASLQDLLTDHYVLDDAVPSLRAALQRAVEAGSFATPADPSEVTRRINTALRAVSGDRHLGVVAPERYREIVARFHPERLDSAETAEPSDSSIDSPPPHRGAQNSQHGHAPAARPHGAPTPAPRPSDAEQRRDREQQGRDRIRELAGVHRVAEINRDGLNQIGYLALERFDGSERALRILDGILGTFTESERILIDLRECAGGDVAAVRHLADVFFEEPTQLLSSTRREPGDSKQTIQEHWTSPVPLSRFLAHKPLDILISERTFSAGESFAFGMRSVGRARLIGQTSGGGGFQNDFFDLPAGFGVSISVGRTFDPRTGRGWQLDGITPDIVTDPGHALSTTLDQITRDSGKLERLTTDQREILSTLQSYSFALYNADASRMADLLAPDFESTHGRGETSIRRDRTAQLEATGDGSWQLPRLFHNRLVRDIAVDGSKARAELVLRETVHQVQLARVSGRWLLQRDDSADKAHG